MKVRGFAHALGISAAAALLAGCGALRQAQGDMQPPIGAPGAMPQAPAERTRAGLAYRLLHSFGGSGDGVNPSAGLIDIKGTLYGTTVYGGSDNAGTVFEITKTGEETVLHSFGGSGDGVQPEAGLIDIKGTLYGTTRAGGAYDFGTVFNITTGGKEKVLHSFDYNGTDGVWPYAGMIDVKGALYGTTEQGGAYYCGSATCGTVFSITTSGTEKVLYSFGKQAEDAAYPVAGLIDVKGALYGTTEYGGANYGGTVFSVTTGGAEQVLHSFSEGTGGNTPTAGLIDVKGTLYGTTSEGGAHSGGTVFRITTSGVEKVAYSFDGGDGSYPDAGLIDVRGALYSTTSEGGAYNDGTIFSITTGGTEKVLHSFSDGTNGNYPDGSDPDAGLIEVSGSFYGTTHGGGVYGNGIIFSLTP